MDRPSYPLTTVPLQVVKVKNSRGGQEGSEGPGVATAESPEPIFLCYLVRSGLEIKEAGESPENQATLLDCRGICQGRQYFTPVITVCEHEM